MGACATKPKVLLKAESGEAPAPQPEDPTSAVTKLENGSDSKATEIVDVDINADDDKVDSKSRSLINLFDDQKEVKESNEKEKTPSEKQEVPPPETEEKASETNPPEPPPSDAVTDKTTIIISDDETPTADPKNENDQTNLQPVIKENLKVEVSDGNNPPPHQNTESSEKSN